MKHKNLYLLLALLCFVGIILIFVFDGYVGTYDSLVADNGRYPQTVEYDQWAEGRYDYVRMASVERGEQLEFTYTVENHRFSAYQADVTVTYMHNDDVISEPLVIPVAAAAFGNAEATWVMEADAFIPAGFPDDQNYNITVVINRGNVQREINVGISALPSKPLLAQ